MSVVIPTREKQKLPEDFAYALWPTKVSDLLDGTPQRDDAELVFHWRDEFWASHWRQRIEQKGTIKLLAAQYTPDYSPYFPKWKITIFSVPKEYLTAAQEILLGGAVEALAERLAGYGLTPDQPVSEVISMNLAQVDHDKSRLTPEQLSAPVEQAPSGEAA